MRFLVVERISVISHTFPPDCTVCLRLTSEHILNRLYGYLKPSLAAVLQHQNIYINTKENNQQLGRCSAHSELGYF